ncbi:MAG: Ig-like domain-containing protein [Cyanobacteriota bacterium]|nr:Ig-like domain-containing protein [Cyanobacteriota bacterium]
MSGQTVTPKKVLQPIDRMALGVMLVLSLLIAILLLSGDRTAPRVRDFSWQDKYIGAEDTAFTLTFSRPMNHASVEANLQIAPPLPGKFSWAGRRMAFTPLSPVPYGTKYQVQLKGAKDQFSQNESKGTSIQPFTGSFSTRDRVFAYVGVEKEEQGRLMLYNLTTHKKTILTPPDLVVMDFKPYPDSDRILFSASDRKSQEQGLLTQQLYSVTTGLSFPSPNKPKPSSSPSPGRIDPILDSKDYQNLKFDLSADGKTIVVQRINRRNPAEFGLWIVQPNAKPRPLKNQPGGNFVIAPDSASVAVAQGQGVAIIPLTPAVKPLDFLPKFGVVLSFAGDGSAAAMVKFNTDYTRSLFLVTNQGIQKELLRTTGSVLSCEFTAQKDTLYCLLTQLIKGQEYQEEPFFAAIDLKAANDSTKQSVVKPLVVLPNQRDIEMSLSPDNLALLFDQLITRPPAATDSLRTNEGQAIATGLLWLLPLVEAAPTDTATQVQPEQLLPGFQPHWLP